MDKDWFKLLHGEWSVAPGYSNTDWVLTDDMFKPQRKYTTYAAAREAAARDRDAAEMKAAEEALAAVNAKIAADMKTYEAAIGKTLWTAEELGIPVVATKPSCKSCGEAAPLGYTGLCWECGLNAEARIAASETMKHGGRVSSQWRSEPIRLEPYDNMRSAGIGAVGGVFNLRGGR